MMSNSDRIRDIFAPLMGSFSCIHVLSDGSAWINSVLP